MKKYSKHINFVLWIGSTFAQARYQSCRGILGNFNLLARRLDDPTSSFNLIKIKITGKFPKNFFELFILKSK